MTDILQESEVYKKLESDLKGLIENGRVTEKEIRDKKVLADDIINSLLAIMKEIDPLFKSMKPVPQPRGSVASQLKVVKPNEFDIDVILKLPVTEEKQNAPKHVHVRIF